MKLALIIDDYLPHSTRVGAKMFHELSVSLVEQGHDVTVITPDSTLTEVLDITLIDNVKVWRFKSGKIKDIGKIERAINETLMSFRAWSAIKSRVTKSTFDGVIYYSPSIFFGRLVQKIKNTCDCKAYLVLRDLFPQWVVDAGMIRSGSLIEKYFKYFEKKSYDQATGIGLMSENNEVLFNQLTGDVYQTHILRNWASTEKSAQQNDLISIREKYGLENKVIFFYGGNIGRAQDMMNLMRLTKSMEKYEKAHFLFIGQGDEVALINQFAIDNELQNFTFMPSVDQALFRSILAQADVGLFSLSRKHSAHNFPGKLLGYMVEKMPILGSVNEGNDLMDVVNDYKAGFITINGQDDELLDNCVSLLEKPELRKSIGENAYALLNSEFSIESATSTIISHLK